MVLEVILVLKYYHKLCVDIANDIILSKLAFSL